MLTPTEQPQNIESPLFFPLLEFQKKISPINMSRLKSWFQPPPPPFTKGRTQIM